MSLTLFINKSDSHCECSGKYVSYSDTVCPHCGGTWDTLSSDYAGGNIARAVIACRPDLEPHFPWEDFWESDEGRAELDAFRMSLQMDSNP